MYIFWTLNLFRNALFRSSFCLKILTLYEYPTFIILGYIFLQGAKDSR